MRTHRLIVIAVVTTLGWVAQSAGAPLPSNTPKASRWHVGSTWAVLMFAQDRQLVGSLVVRFTDEKAISCMAGDWKRLEVLRRQFNDPDGFLATKPLSYIFERGELTLGVTEVCDGYVFLRGVPTDAGLTGDYGTLGLDGFHKLGSFAAAIIKE
jgi:hypothetical protein